jgi:hypothetical protein
MRGLALLVLCVAALADSVRASTDPIHTDEKLQYDVSILIPVHKAPLAVLRSTWRQLNDLLISSESNLKLEVLWTRVNEGDDSSPTGSVWERATAAASSSVGGENSLTKQFSSFKHVQSSSAGSDSISAAFNRYLNNFECVCKSAFVFLTCSFSF